MISNSSLQVSHCHKMPQELKDQQGNQPGKTFMPYTQTNYRMHPMGGADGHPGRFKSLDEITCFKCGDTGHFANKCPKGHLAFLSNNQSKKWIVGSWLLKGNYSSSLRFIQKLHSWHFSPAAWDEFYFIEITCNFKLQYCIATIHCKSRIFLFLSLNLFHN